MQIPAQPATSADAVQLRRDVTPAQPAAPVAGVSEQAQRLDSRAALRWAQPVFKAQAGQLMRDGASASLAPAGAAAYPQLSMLASLLGPWMARAEMQMLEGSAPSWPNPTADDGAAPLLTQPARTAVQQALDRLLSALSRSDAFSASRLVQSWWLRAEDAPQDDASQVSQQTRWMAALSPDSEGAQLAARLLLTGQVLWEGPLLADLPARILRHDAWRGEEDGLQPLEKGAALDISVELPGLGPLRIVGRQWGKDVEVDVHLPPGREAQLNQRWEALQGRLRALGSGVQLQQVPVTPGGTSDPGAGLVR